MTEYKSKSEHIRVLLSRGYSEAVITAKFGYSRGAIKHALRTIARGGLQKRGRKPKQYKLKPCPHCGRLMLEGVGKTSRSASSQPAAPSAPTP